MQEPFVSVIVPTYARTELLQDAIKSVLKQTYVNYEIIVVDDNGREGIFRESTEKFMEQYKGVNCIKYILHEENRGGCVARNTGIQNAKGELIAFLDDDDRWKENYLTEMVERFSDAEVGVVYCHNDLLVDGQLYEGHRERWFKGNVRQQLISGWCPDSTSLVIVRKKCFECLGGFDEKLKSFQDYDMWLKISERYNFDYVQKNLIIKLENHGEQVSMNPYKRQDGMIYLKEKWETVFTKEEKEKFNFFLKTEEQQLRKNFLVYNRKNHIKCNYVKLYIDYCKTSASLKNKVLIIFVVIFGINTLKLYDKVCNNRFTRI